MDFVWHGTVGSLIYMVPLRLIGITNDYALGIAGASGFTVGVAPDAVGDLEPEPEQEQKRWNWYNDCHWTGAICSWMVARWYWYWTMPWFIHAWSDTFFHKMPVLAADGTVLIKGQRWWIWNERLPQWAGLWLCLLGAIRLLMKLP